MRQSEEFSTEGEEIEDQNNELKIPDKSMSDEFKEEAGRANFIIPEIQGVSF